MNSLDGELGAAPLSYSATSCDPEKRYMIEEVGLVQFGRRGLEELGVLIVGRIAFEDSSGMGCRVDLLEHSDGDVGVDLRRVQP